VDDEDFQERVISYYRAQSPYDLILKQAVVAEKKSFKRVVMIYDRNKEYLSVITADSSPFETR
jgi:hypothetical protein